MELWKMHFNDIKEYLDKGGKRVILPIGTIEAHGALPLGTDVIIPYNMSLKLAERINAIVSPPVYYGITNSLLPYPGSLTVEEETFSDYIFEICESYVRHGFVQIILMNGHGGNIKPLDSLLSRLWKELGAYSILVNWWLYVQDITKQVYGMAGGHAGIDETAAVMYYEPSLVRKELFKEDMSEPYSSAIKSVPFPGSIILYKEGEGMPDFDEGLAKVYMEKVEKVIIEKVNRIITKWENIE